MFFYIFLESSIELSMNLIRNKKKTIKLGTRRRIHNLIINDNRIWIK